jgi:regulator of nonsense transcripts 1
MVAENFWLEQLRPREVVNEFASVKARKDGNLEVVNDRYKTKIR